MADVYDVADFFVKLANQSEDDQMTNLKVNKLIYYAQGAFLARTGRPLFDEDIEPWPLGPVVPKIYHKYKVCGRGPITSEGDLDPKLFTEEEYEVLLDVMRELGQYTGAALVSRTHSPGTPWSRAALAHAPVLEREDMKDYFTKHPVPRLGDKLSIPRVTAFPADWYSPDEDEEWENVIKISRRITL